MTQKQVVISNVLLGGDKTKLAFTIGNRITTSDSWKLNLPELRAEVAVAQAIVGKVMKERESV
ncbi:hypothetical protein BC938DRAFT_472148 [Jimgerdemannia flammicorona]|uniref:Uncharacterized protein n=1 Tax=Jimgerdemannia flammicorona TaxID=994334 RepID=A0A433QU85_9FUNG|nr:hypothetical protein BC938DRAFT_472148 [Jimgerdemannia flammicorona]